MAARVGLDHFCHRNHPFPPAGVGELDQRNALDAARIRTGRISIADHQQNRCGERAGDEIPARSLPIVRQAS
jgi:hypothetical protein